MPGTPEILNQNYEVDNEAVRVREFTRCLGEVVTSSLLEPDFDFEKDQLPVDAAERRFLNEQYTGRLTFYGADTDELPQSFEPRVSRGGKKSNHGVFFGDLIFEDREVSVAVKPHTNNASKTCFGDFFKGSAVRELGIYTLKPFGMIIGEVTDTKAYSFTVLEEGLSTLDSIDWSYFLTNMNDNPGMQELWRSISDKAAMMHADGIISHGDLAARNIATLPEGDAAFIDWELARICKVDSSNVQLRVEQSYTDLQKLLESMALPPFVKKMTPGIGLLYGIDTDWWKAFEDVFFDEYKSARMVMAHNSPQKEAYKDVETELKVLEINLQKDMQMAQDICESIEEEQ